MTEPSQGVATREQRRTAPDSAVTETRGLTRLPRRAVVLGVDCGEAALRHHLRGADPSASPRTTPLDELLSRVPLALLLGMLFDQHLPSGAQDTPC